MNVTINLQVLAVEDAKQAADFLHEIGITADENSDILVDVSPEQFKKIEDYQDNPHLPRFCRRS